MTETKTAMTQTLNRAEDILFKRYQALASDPARARAFESFKASGLPHRRMENWRWSDFKARLDTLFARSDSHTTAQADPFETLDGIICLRFKNGVLAELPDLPEGIDILQKRGGYAFANCEDIPLGALTAALVPATYLIEVTQSYAQPIKLVFEGEGAAAFARIDCVIRPDIELSLIETYRGGAKFNASLTSFNLNQGAKLSRYMIQPATQDQAHAITSEIHLDAQSRYEQTSLAFGGHLARIETRGTHHGPESEMLLKAAYLAGPGHHIDHTSHIRHGAPHCITRQRTKGAVLNKGTGVFQGKFHVPRVVGQKTDADMQHNALLLEEGAIVNAKPELEIYADDVACAHGNTCGALDEAALFYMRQRGIPDLQARAMLTEAFISEIFDTDGQAHSALATLREAAKAWLAQLSQ